MDTGRKVRVSEESSGSLDSIIEFRSYLANSKGGESPP